MRVRLELPLQNDLEHTLEHTLEYISKWQLRMQISSYLDLCLIKLVDIYNIIVNAFCYTVLQKFLSAENYALTILQ